MLKEGQYYENIFKRFYYLYLQTKESVNLVNKSLDISPWAKKALSVIVYCIRPAIV